ncbi:MAG: ATP-dependent helicase [Synergistetes bacterium HGW-Synergistetes-1]|nr:MAG: ATP-dependent helicase [Synergistetes bacterium HGW-Synergistetes-1]
MIVIHVSYADNRFFVWGECSFGSGELISSPASSVSGIPRLPWDAGSLAVHDILKTAGIRHSRRIPAESSAVAYVDLPAYNGCPIPSSPLLGELPEISGEPSVERFSVEALHITHEELTALFQLIKESREKLPVPGLLWGNDLKYVLKGLEYASLMVTRGTYLPGMESSDGSYFSVWRPLHLAKYQDGYSAYVNSLPPVTGSFSLTSEKMQPDDPQDTADSILEAFLEEIVRRAQAVPGRRGKQVDQTNPHDIWLRSLTWPRSALHRWNDEMGPLCTQIQEWTDSVRVVTNQPWRLFLRLEEPLSGNAEGTWTLSWHLQSAMDQTLTVPAEKVWSPGPAERKWFRTSGANPRRYLLQLLGQISSSVPAIARSLNEPSPVSCTMSFDELIVFLHDHVPEMLEHGIQVQFPSTWGAPSDRPRLAVKGNIREGEVFSAGNRIDLGDLMDIDWSVSIGKDVLTEEELSLLRKLKTPLANIRGKWVLLYRDELEKVMDGIKKLPRKITRKDALISSFRESKGDLPLSAITGSVWLDSVRSILTGAEQIKQIRQPDGFCGELRPYQLKGLSWLSWLAEIGLGGCLADDMGLGKTVQALALLKTRIHGGEKDPVLLICPTSVIENWRREAEHFVPDLSVLIHHGTRRPRGDKFVESVRGRDLVISSYSLLHRDNETFKKADWSGVILDEAQNIKNPETRQSKAARAIKAKWHFALTGTPVENHVGDMWSIMEFLMPGLLPNKSRFIREFMRPIQAGDTSALHKIKKITGPFILRRLKTDKTIISDLPEKIETEVFCSLNKEQASLYGAVLDHMEANLTGSSGIKRKGAVLSAITSLKQVCNHPALYLKDRSQIAGRSGKLARLTEIAEEMLSVGDRALIFTQYAEMGAMLKSYLQETFGREALFLHGGVERQKRDEMVRKFQESKDAPPFFVLSLKAGGTGLNLTGANHVVMFDRWWNPAVEQQAVDRAYRIGQKERVQVHYFCCKGTLEEKIEQLIRSKKDIADSVVSDGENWLTEMTDSELKQLFKLSRDAVEDIG